MAAKHSLTWWFYQLDTLSHAWTLRVGASFRLAKGVFVGTARDLGNSTYTYAITEQPSAVVCLNYRGNVMAQFHTAFDNIKRLQVRASVAVAGRQPAEVACVASVSTLTHPSPLLFVVGSVHLCVGSQ